MKTMRPYLWLYLVAAMALAGCVSTEEQPLPEEALAAEGEEMTEGEEITEGEEGEEEFCLEEDEFCEEEEEEPETAWNGIDPELGEGEGEGENWENSETVDPEELIEQALIETETEIEGPLPMESGFENLIENNYETTQIEPAAPVLPQPPPEVFTVGQGDLTLSCQPTGAQDMVLMMTRYGCKAYLKSGSYYGVIKGWWEVRRSDGVRVRIKDLVFRDGSYDATFSVPNQDALAGVQAAPSYP